MTGNNSFLYHDVPVPDGFVHIYLHTTLPGLYGMPFPLSKPETERAEEYDDINTRSRYLQAHVFLREVLSSYLAILPVDIALEYTPNGRLVLAKVIYERPVFFSISYAGTQVMVGIASHPVGVDIAEMQEVANMADMAQDLFSSAERRYMQLIADPTEQKQYFFKVWALKEAFVKGLGLGVIYGLQRFSALPGMGATDPVLQSSELGWIMKQIDVPLPYTGAVAVKCLEK